MNKALESKVKTTIARLREIWRTLEDKHRFVAFSTGKDSLAVAAMLYEAVGSEHPPCLYSHHDLEFPEYEEYAEEMKAFGFAIEIVRPFLQYFELIERGIGFLTLKDAWCRPLLIGTGFFEWLQIQGAQTPKTGVMFRGMSGSEYSHSLHSPFEIYERLDMPCFNPLLDFTKSEIIEILKRRYALPLNPIYEHMERTYCICCYTLEARSQAYGRKRYPKIHERYYGSIEKMLFESGLMLKYQGAECHKSREEKIVRHGFVHWKRLRAQNTAGAVKRRLRGGALAYNIRDEAWIATKHLSPVKGRWARQGSVIRFWDVPEKVADSLIKRMINCLDCGFCVVECFVGRRFDRKTKTLRIEGCIQCGKCLRLKFCMGWRHRFWRRVIVEGTDT
jgi:3'-phosphoadenosine 5'-phosphosulfate sulfotransferase (PAPS reductase)/FAD synthetase